MSSRSLPECEQDFLLDVLDSHGPIQTIKSYAAFGECSLSLKSEMLSDNGERPYFPRQEIMTDKIKPEVLALIGSWNGHCEQKQLIDTDVKMTDTFVDSRTSTERFEPCRCCTSMEPPRRFYRRFWRSIAHRALKHAADRTK